MKTPEGRKDAFMVLYERYPTEILKKQFIFVYDFGCNLREYLLNREPVLFQETLVLVDRFHKNKGHLCSQQFCPDTFPYL